MLSIRDARKGRGGRSAEASPCLLLPARSISKRFGLSRTVECEGAVVETPKSAADCAGGPWSRASAALLGVAIASAMWCGHNPAGAAEAPRLSFLVAPFANL